MENISFSKCSSGKRIRDAYTIRYFLVYKSFTEVYYYLDKYTYHLNVDKFMILDNLKYLDNCTPLVYDKYQNLLFNLEGIWNFKKCVVVALQLVYVYYKIATVVGCSVHKNNQTNILLNTQHKLQKFCGSIFFITPCDDIC